MDPKRTLPVFSEGQWRGMLVVPEKLGKTGDWLFTKARLPDMNIVDVSFRYSCHDAGRLPYLICDRDAPLDRIPEFTAAPEDAGYAAAEYIHIHSLVSQFAQEMETRLLENACEGRRGWRSPGSRSHIKGQLGNAAWELMGTGQASAAVDVANFAAMLWWHEHFAELEVEAAEW